MAARAAFRALCLAAGLGLIQELALAQTSPKPKPGASSESSIAGDWLLSTSEFDGDCKITGVMNFRPTPLANTYTCTFETEQICGPENLSMYIRVKQSCTATKVGQQVAIKSAVTRVVESRMEGFPDWKSQYLADNFIVTLQKNRAEMIGDHYDEQRELKARFWRDSEQIS